MEKGDLTFLTQLIDSLDETFLKLEKAKLEKDNILFDKLKKNIMDLQKKIEETLR
ncbi:hypothetical protein HOD88_01655 [archaeon]|jgi:hypothetical protein|nr:hypothetical protein [archaeon]